MKKVDLDQRTDAWKAWRRRGISATDSSVILGLNPNKTPLQLWREKRGLAIEPDLSVIPAVRHGIRYEMEAINMAEARLCNVIVPGDCAEFDDNPIFRASFDGLTLEGFPVEVKCPQKRTWNEVEKLGEKSDAYQLYQWQVQHQIMVSGAKKGFLIFFDTEKATGMTTGLVCLDNLICFEILRDEEMIKKIREAGESFWQLVESGKEPDADPLRDFYVPPAAQVTSWMSSAQGWTRLQAQIEELEAKIKNLKAAQASFQDEMVGMMGNACKADFGGVSISVSHVAGRVDYKTLFEKRGLTATEDELDSVRGKPSTRVRVKATGRMLDKSANPENLDNTIKELEAESSMQGWCLTL